MNTTLKNVSFAYDGHPIITGLSLTFPKRGILAVMGASGSGKTTLLRLICGLLTPDSGEIVRPEGQRPIFLFQEDRLLPWSTALENVSLITEDDDVSRAWLQKVGLAGWENVRPGQLSGGMCRRVAIARALAAQGDILLMDEPLKGLDAATKQDIMALIKERCRDIPGVMVTHYEEEAACLADEVFSLDGAAVACGV